MDALSNANRFVGHERCPQCEKMGKDRRGNNLGRWEDGHAYCFSCGYIISGNQTQLLENLAKRDDNDEDDTQRIPDVGIKTNVMWFPNDASSTIDWRALSWLAKYGIMREEIIDNNIQWSEQYKWLIFPIYAHGKDSSMLAWQARTDIVPETAFSRGTNIQHRKWYSKGDIHQILHLINWNKWVNTDTPIIIVEDIVSAIKVSRYAIGMPLFGAMLPLRIAMRLKALWNNYIVWLDGNKYDESQAIANRLNLLGMTATSVYTEKDPKECSDELIKEIIKNAN